MTNCIEGRGERGEGSEPQFEDREIDGEIAKRGEKRGASKRVRRNRGTG